MRVGEEVFAVRTSRRRDDTLNVEEYRLDGGSRRRPNDIMRVLTKRAIRVSGTVRVEMHEVDGGAKKNQKGEKSDEQDTSSGIR
jgi:hypothetical protein